MRQGKHPTSGVYWDKPKPASPQAAQGSNPQAAQRRVRFSRKQPEKPATGAATSASIPLVSNQEGIMHWSDEHDPSWEQRVQEEANLYEELALADSFFMPDEFW